MILRNVRSKLAPVWEQEGRPWRGGWLWGWGVGQQPGGHHGQVVLPGWLPCRLVAFCPR